MSIAASLGITEYTFSFTIIPELFQNIHNITLLKKCGCDVTSGAQELQVANLPEKFGSYLVVILSER